MKQHICTIYGQSLLQGPVDPVLYTTDGGLETELPAHAEVLSKKF